MATAKSGYGSGALDALKTPTSKSLKDMYTEWITPAVASIKTSLEKAFGLERFQFSVTRRPSLSSWLEEQDKGTEAANRTFLQRCIRGVENLSHTWRRTMAYEILIHFPELTVRNSRRGSQRITDMYIKVMLSPFLNDSTGGTLFTGCRTSYTFAEFSSGYNFSHLSGSVGDSQFTHFCLGETHFSTLCRSVATEFNANFFGLFCFQLEQYLSWESLEGGPYKRLENTHERGHYSGVSINGNDRTKYYKEFLKSGFVPNLNVKSNPYYYTLEVVEDDAFRQAVTKCVDNDTHLQFWDSERKVAADRSLGNRQVEIDNAMRSRRNTFFTFNGKDVKFQITDASTKEEKDDKIKVAHQQILNHVATSLNRSMLKNIKDDFSKKRRVYPVR